MDRLAGDAEAPRDLHHRDPVADHREHRLIPLLYGTQLHKRVRECVADQAEPASPIRRAVSPVSRSRCVTYQAEPITLLGRREGVEPPTF